MNKLNHLLNIWQKGTVMLVSSLNEMGYSNNLIWKYSKSGWIKQVGYGVYKLANDDVDLFGALYALQNQAGLKLFPGGISALSLKGYSHYIKMQQPAYYIFNHLRLYLPKWFEDSYYTDEVEIVKPKLFEQIKDSWLSGHKVKDFSLLISTPELAAFEMLSLVPQKHTFEEASLIMESLTTLRSSLVQELLKNCRSVKVKRLFLYLAEEHRHSWFNDLKLKNINLGSGKRVIVKKGRLNKKYNITVPK